MKLILAVVGLTVVCSMASAGVISEDVVYWLKGGAMWWNPTTEALQANADKLEIKVQQTVYDNEWTRSITGLDTNGYLYCYSVTNFVLYPSPQQLGIRMFEVSWPVRPLYVAISPQNPTALWDPGSSMWIQSGWVASIDGTNPRFYWQDDDLQPITVEPGLLPGSTAAFWAISPIAADEKVAAKVAGVPDPGTGYPFLYGETSGPQIPEPAALAVLVSSLGGLALSICRRRR